MVNAGSTIEPTDETASALMMDPNGFLFPVGSAVWKVCREWCVLVYGPAAAILQVAHPRIAQGVADHSAYRTDTLGRLKRTLRAVTRISFGTRAEAERMRTKLAAVHRSVQGKVSRGIGGPSSYSAFEPDLLMWVLATLIWGAINGREAIDGPLSIPEKRAFYREMRVFGAYFGLREEAGPPNWEAFEAYFASMLAEPWLGAHPLCSVLTRSIVRPRDDLLTRMLGMATDFIPSETVPAPLRERLGIKSTWWTRARRGIFQRVFPCLFKRLPERLRLFPEAREALRRARNAR